jgi:hypothetical protein
MLIATIGPIVATELFQNCSFAQSSEIRESGFCMVYISSLQKNGAKAYKSRFSKIRPGTRVFVFSGSKLKTLKTMTLKKLIVHV